MGALDRTPSPADEEALSLLLAATPLRDNRARTPLRWCRRLHDGGFSDGFSIGLQAMFPYTLSRDERKRLVCALQAAEADTAASSHWGAALLRQDGRHAFLDAPANAPWSVSIPSYIRDAIASLPKDGAGLADPRLSAHERLALAGRLHLSSLEPAPRPGPSNQHLLYLRTQGHTLLLEHRPNHDLPRLLGFHA